MAFTFLVLFIADAVLLIVNIYLWATNGLQFVLHGMNFIERIYYSTYLKWLIVVDAIWLAIALIIVLKRKHYKTDPELHYLKYNPIKNPTICVVIPTYNEEIVIESVVRDFISQENVKDVIVVDNHSTDNTANIAERCGAKAIRKSSNMGLAHSCIIGLKESLKTDANIIVLVEGDGSFNGYDISKMIPYLDNCDMVEGTRQIQILSEQKNQLGMIHVWGNYFLAKAIQIKFFSLLHMGVVNLSDVGCLYRAIRREALEQIIGKFTPYETGEVILRYEITLFMTLEAIKNNLRVIEIPVTFKKRIGISKIGSQKKMKAIMIGLRFIWYIIRD